MVKDIVDRFKEEPVRWSAMITLVGMLVAAGGVSFSMAAYAWRNTARRTARDVRRAIEIQALTDHQLEHTQQISEILGSELRTRHLLGHMRVILDRLALRAGVSTRIAKSLPR